LLAPCVHVQAEGKLPEMHFGVHIEERQMESPPKAQEAFWAAVKHVQAEINLAVHTNEQFPETQTNEPPLAHCAPSAAPWVHVHGAEKLPEQSGVHFAAKQICVPEDAH